METERLKENLFAILFSEARICGSLFPVCEIKYKDLKIEDYATRVLENKPDSSINDDFLNQVYKRIEVEESTG